MPRCREVLFQCIENCSIILEFVTDSETVEEYKKDELCRLMKKNVYLWHANCPNHMGGAATSKEGANKAKWSDPKKSNCPKPTCKNSIFLYTQISFTRQNSKRVPLKQEFSLSFVHSLYLSVHWYNWLQLIETPKALRPKSLTRKKVRRSQLSNAKNALATHGHYHSWGDTCFWENKTALTKVFCSLMSCSFFSDSMKSSGN